MKKTRWTGKGNKSLRNKTNTKQKRTTTVKEVMQGRLATNGRDIYILL